MKKIMFNDRYGLTQAVLEGRKTMTRRIITCPKEFKGEYVAGFYVYKRLLDNAIIQWPCMYDADERTFDGGEILPKYHIGEVVAVAQSYERIYEELWSIDKYEASHYAAISEKPGWTNKMFVKAELMLHRIRIADIRVERLQDISDEECMREGARFIPEIGKFYFENMRRDEGFYFDGPREAFAALIDKVSGRDTWESNPWCFAYEFELVR